MRFPVCLSARISSLPVLACVLAILCFNAAAFAQDKKDKSDQKIPEPPTRFAADRPLDLLHIKLELAVDVENEHVDGKATLEMVALRDVTGIKLNADNFETSRVALAVGSGRPSAVKYTNDGEFIDVELPRTFKTGEKLSLFIDYAIDHPESGLHFFGPSANEPDVPYVVWSQGESITNSHWVPCFDHPNEMMTTEMIVTTKRGYQ
ncbi:MAG: hypothetical protein IID41_11915 [Planctomycetes bacterium]|nr:hypothetical protein [Planctomycetota bacterium]